MGICSKSGKPPAEVPAFTDGAYPCFRCFVWHMEGEEPPSPEEWRRHLAAREVFAHCLEKSDKGWPCTRTPRHHLGRHNFVKPDCRCCDYCLQGLCCNGPNCIEPSAPEAGGKQ